jgi:ribosomal protein S18 acetylase RimI-like enzyme
MLFRKGTPADADAIAALHTASWRSAYAALLPAAYLRGPVAEEHREKWRARTADLSANGGDPLLLTAFEEGELRGFAYLRATDDHRVHLDNLHVHPDRVGTGLGRRLLRRGFAWAQATYPGRDVFLEVLRGNDRAIVFYERQGGLRTAERPLRLAADLVVDEVEYTWPAAQVGHLGEDGPDV